MRFQTLGTIRLRATDGSDVEAVLAQPMQVSLLAYLAVCRPRGFHRRDTLLGLFWPELDADHARGALNQAVYRLRGSLGRDVVTGRGKDEIGIDERLLWTDAVAFEQAVENESYRQALELYGGDFLPGYFLSGAPTWERWMEGERARLQRLASTAAWHLAEAAAGDGRAEDTGHWGRRAHALRPRDEASLRRLISLLDRVGDRAGAVRAYDEAVDLFAAEYGTEPSPETKASIERVRARTRPTPTPDATPLSRPPDHGTPSEASPHDAAGRPAAADDVPETSIPNAPNPERWSLSGVGVAAAVILLGVALLTRPAGPGTASAERPELSETQPESPEPSEAAADDRPDAAAAGTRVPAARTEYRRGTYYLSQLGPEPARLARNHFQRALDLDPTYADAWSGLAAALTHLAQLSVIPSGEAYPRARAAAEEALRLDPRHGEARALLAWSLAAHDWDTPAADSHFVAALQLAPTSAKAHRFHAAFLRNLGRFDEALAAISRARELDPLFAFSHIEEGLIHYAARDYERAIEEYELFLEIAPEHVHAHTFIGLAETQRGRYEDALAAFARADPGGTNPTANAVRGYIYGRTGRPDEARRILALLDREAGRRDGVHMRRAVVRVGLGEHERALDLLERGLEEPSWHMRLLKIEPFHDPLRGEPRYQAILRRVGLVDDSVPTP